MLKKVMNRAWAIARKGYNQMGGKVTDYLAEAMKIAWAYYKKVKSDEALKARIKQALKDKWEENPTEMAYKNGSFSTYVKIFFNSKIAFNGLNETQKIKYSEQLTARGY